MSKPYGTGNVCFLHNCGNCEFHVIPIPGWCKKYDCYPGEVDDPQCSRDKQLKLDL